MSRSGLITAKSASEFGNSAAVAHFPAFIIQFLFVAAVAVVVVVVLIYRCF